MTERLYPKALYFFNQNIVLLHTLRSVRIEKYNLKGGDIMKTAEEIIAFLQAELDEAIELHEEARDKKDMAQAHANLLKAYTISELLDVIKN